MPITNITAHLPAGPAAGFRQIGTEPITQAPSGFADMLKSAIADVNQKQNQSDSATAALAQGKPIDLHEVMIASQKATITLQAALEIRNKAVEAYQEIMRMQV